MQTPGTENTGLIAGRIEVEPLGIVDSTSRHARRLIEGGGFGDRPRVFVADEQTGGVGRFGRAWASPPGGLWMTLVWPLKGSGAPGVLDGLGLRVGLAMLRAVDRALGGSDRGATLKWPNDILINGRKVAGALCETVSQGQTVFILIGVGINANFHASILPESLRTNATTLEDVLGARTDLDALRTDLVERLAGALGSEGYDDATHEAISSRLHGVGAPAVVTMPDRTVIEGTLLGLKRDGRLRLATAQGEITLPSGAELAAAP